MSEGALTLPPVAELADVIAPARAALLVVDVQVDFAAPYGVIGAAGVDMTTAEAAVERIGELIAAARAAGVTIAFIRVMTREETDSSALKTWLARTGRAGDGAICRVGSGGEDYYRVAPVTGDIEIAKLMYNGFHGTDLEGQLRARGVDTVVIAGLTTDCCVDSTARDAFHRDFHLLVVADACAAYDEALHRHALTALQMHCGLLATSAAVIAAWRGR